MYGQTEAAARMSLLPPNDMHNKETSIGKAISCGSFSLIDDFGQEINKSNIPGELFYSGDNVSMRYAESYLHLKECEFRFNNRKQNLYKILLGIFRKESF